MNLEIVSAGAGAGKTYDLIAQVVRAVQAGTRPSRIMAATFTNAAADELVHRVRQTLLAAGRRDAAEGIYSGLVGTIHHTLGALLTEFCWEAGLPPTLDIMEPDDAKILFSAALGDVEFADDERAFHAALERMSLEDQWTEQAKKIADHARDNAISPDRLRREAGRSWETLKRYFPEDPMRWDACELWKTQTLTALANAIASLTRRELTQKNERDGLALLQEVERETRFRDDLTWWSWMRLASVSAGAKNREVIQPLNELAGQAFWHPQLALDVQTVITGVFERAAMALETFQTLKQTRGVVDFGDQEALFYAIIQRPEVQQALARRIDALWVDEIQDCSPLELAIMTEISGLVSQACWVGDPKQAIYSFRGTDPELIGWAIREMGDAGSTRVLNTSRRSRPPLVEFVNDLFTPVFAGQTMPAERVRLTPHRIESDAQGSPFTLWRLDAKTSNLQMSAVAEGIRDVLSHAEAYPVEDHGRLRAIRGSDIAILCRKNADCTDVASALNQLGIRAVIGREGLFDTPEIQLALAAVRYLFNRDDTLAVAELLHLGTEHGQRDTWLADWLDPHLREHLFQSPRIAALDAARTLAELTLSEQLDRALVAVDAFTVVVGWGEGDVRRGNLEKLRGLAQTFENRAKGMAVAATVPTFLHYLEEIRKDKRHEGNKQSQSRDAGAVNVLTYHRAKGLEWPMVVLTFQNAPKATPFGVTVLSPDERNVEKPLEGRWIRFWPWPFGKKAVDVGLDHTIANSPELADARQTALNETARLYYVGMTRARDYLIWAIGTKSIPGFDALCDIDGYPVVHLPEEDAERMRVGATGHPVRQIHLSAPDSAEGAFDPPLQIWALPHGEDPWRRIPRHVAPSHSEDTKGEPYRIVERVVLGQRLPLAGTVDMEQLGQMVHGFLAATPAHPRDRWEPLARDMMARWNLFALQISDLIEAANRYRGVLQDRHPHFLERVEWPVEMHRDGRIVSGRIDSLWEGPDGYLIVDHKTFPGREELWEDKALEYAGQLEWYRSMVTAATGKPVRECWIHFPILGRMMRVDAPGFSD